MSLYADLHQFAGCRIQVFLTGFEVVRDLSPQSHFSVFNRRPFRYHARKRGHIDEEPPILRLLRYDLDLHHSGIVGGAGESVKATKISPCRSRLCKNDIGR